MKRSKPHRGDPKGSVTTLLYAWKAGEEQALDRLVERVMGEVRKIARLQLRNENPRPLESRELVNECYLRLQGVENLPMEHRGDLYGLVRCNMRRILVDLARARLAQKRGGEATHVSLQSKDMVSRDERADILALNQAWERLEKIEPGLATIVDLKVFQGLTIGEMAADLGIGETAVKKLWKKAFLWLCHELDAGGKTPGGSSFP